MQNIVFTFVGDDKAGLVERIAQIVARHEGNWLESRLSQMAGKFAGIVSVAIAEKQADALLEALASLADTGLSVVAERSHTGGNTATHSAELQILGNDRPGIVHEISAALAAMQINIVELSSEVQSAPMAGIPLFVASITIDRPPEEELARLRDKLEQAANRLDIDISLQLSPGSETTA
jgi:glycine cleavage system regulatory protein